MASFFLLYFSNCNHHFQGQRASFLVLRSDTLRNEIYLHNY